MIYLISDDEYKYCKIGYTSDLYSRLNNIQVCNPNPVHLLAVIEGTTKDEEIIHELFAKYRHRAEWFLYNQEIVSYFMEGERRYEEKKKHIILTLPEKTITYLRKNFSERETMNIFDLTSYIGIKNNILQKKDKPVFNYKNVAYLFNTRLDANVHVFVQKLFEKGILSELKTSRDTFISFNPYVLRVSKNVEPWVDELFWNLIKQIKD